MMHTIPQLGFYDTTGQQGAFGQQQQGGFGQQQQGFGQQQQGFGQQGGFGFN